MLVQGKLVRNSFSRAIVRVERVGENRAAWAKETNSAGVTDPMAAWVAWDGGGVGRLVGRDRCQSLVVGSCCPVNMMVSANLIVTCVAVNTTVHPASQSWPIDKREGHARVGTTCTRRAARGSMGKSRLASWVEVIMLPLGL